MELSPVVDQSGWFRGYRADNIIAQLFSQQHQHDGQEETGTRTNSSQGTNDRSIIVDDIPALGRLTRGRVFAGSDGSGDTSRHGGGSGGSPSSSCLLPSHVLANAAREFAAALGIENTRRLTPLVQSNILNWNISFLKDFVPEDVKLEEWTPEMTYSASVMLLPDEFFADSHLPLSLLVLPLWIKAAGRTGNDLPRSEAAYYESLFDGYVGHNEDRATKCKLRNSKNKFAYIQKVGDKRWSVMSRDEAAGGVIDGNEHQGEEFLRHAADVLRHVASDPSVPNRPGSRLKRKAEKLEQFQNGSKASSVRAQIQLRYCEDELVVDPASLFRKDEPRINVLLSIWLASRRNIPTVITISRKSMCRLSPESVWWSFFLTHKATLPPRAILGHGAAAVQALLTGHCMVDMEKLHPPAAGHGSRVAFTLGHYNTFLSSIYRTPRDHEGDEMSETGSHSSTVVPPEKVRDYLLKMLQATDESDALERLHEIREEAVKLAFRVHKSLQMLRDLRLLREDILAHASNAWNVVSGCQAALAGFYRIFGKNDVASELLKSRRSVCNHFAPDIYAFAYPLAACGGYIRGYAAIPEHQKWESHLRSMRNDLDTVLVPPLKAYVKRMIQEESRSESIPEAVRKAPTFLEMLQEWDNFQNDAGSVLGMPLKPRPPEPMEPIPEDEITGILEAGEENRPPVSGELNLDAPDFPQEVRRHTRGEIAKVMCCMTAPGRRYARDAALSDHPTSVAVVWSVLRGVDDRDWIKRYGESASMDVEFEIV